MEIGFNQTGLFDVKHQRSMIGVSGTMFIGGRVCIGAGSRIEVAKGAKLVFEGGAANSAGLIIECQDYIKVGDNTVISWDTCIIDCDFHYVLDINSNKTRVNHKPIRIGERVWICAGSIILKGSSLPDGCILSAGSVLNKEFSEMNCLLSGNPATVVKKNVTRSDIEIR